MCPPNSDFSPVAQDPFLVLGVLVFRTFKAIFKHVLAVNWAYCEIRRQQKKLLSLRRHAACEVWQFFLSVEPF